MTNATELQVVVRSRSDGSWSTGFTIVETLATPAGPRYRVRRLSDGTVLWGLFTPAELAPDSEDRA